MCLLRLIHILDPSAGYVREQTQLVLLQNAFDHELVLDVISEVMVSVLRSFFFEYSAHEVLIVLLVIAFHNVVLKENQSVLHEEVLPHI